MAEWPGDEVKAFLDQLAKDDSQEARMTLAALAALGASEEITHQQPPPVRPSEGALSTREVVGDDSWVALMGRVGCEGGWYGKADPYGEQVLAVLAFRYDNGKEPHLVVVGIDQVNGGYAVDAAVEEPAFLDELDLPQADPAEVAGRILDAFELTDSVLGAPVAETLHTERAAVLARARSIPDAVRHAAPDLALADLPELPGAGEAFEKLVEFVGDRPLWWSPARVSAFMTSWLPREAIMSDAAVEAMPEVLRAWTARHGDLPEVIQVIDEMAPWLPALMAEESLAGLRKRMAGGEGGYAAQ